MSPKLPKNFPLNLLVKDSQVSSITINPLSFANFIATVDTIDPDQRIWVLMDFMGQKTRMQVTADQLQLAK